jgi:cell division transport system ATP-binding protein
MSAHVVDLQNVSIYQNETLVLSDVNFSISKGDFIYIIGRTGSGKSSLLKTLYGELPLRHGTGQVAGFDLRDLTWKEIPFLRRKLGIIFQDFQLLMDRSVEANLEFALRATGWEDKLQIKQKIDDMLRMVDLHTKHFKMPHQISGGEQQRVVIARALLNNPELILADEPTGNLDPRTTEDIMNLIFQISKETHTPVLMATHNYSLLEKYPAEIYKCENGRIMKEEGMMMP